MIRIANLVIPLTYNEEMLKIIAAKHLQIEHHRILQVRIDKRAVNALNKADIFFDLSLLVHISGDENEVVSANKRKGVSTEIEIPYCIVKNKALKMRPVVVGCGPSGLFAALILAQAGERPILLERGLDVDARTQKVNAFWHSGILDTRTNVQFGEGGAGAFSDGKLKIGQKSPRKMMILNELVASGAPEEILYLDKPHIGTDRLKDTVKTIRKKIIGLGGEVHFNALVTDFLFQNKQVTGVRYFENKQITGVRYFENKQITGVRYSENNVMCELETDNVVLAIGHSARDTLVNLYESGVHMAQKHFAIGVRIEHPQALINQIQYGTSCKNPVLGAANYRMVVHLKNGAAVYTFCMCPGGAVVSAASEENGLTTNGMSTYARDGENANTALLVTINQKSLQSALPLAAIAYQRKLETAAFAAGGGGYKAPVQRLEDFMHKRTSTAFGAVMPTYRPGTQFAEVDAYLPETITDSLRQGIVEMGEWMPGFIYPDAILTGAETRSSSPVLILRGETLEAEDIAGLYPCGEGSGYSGGIISAAVDGVLCAERILGIDGGNL